MMEIVGGESEEEEEEMEKDEEDVEGNVMKLIVGGKARGGRGV